MANLLALRAMKLFRLIQAVAVLGPALAFGQVETTAQCNDTFEDCKEDCTMEFGTSLNTREEFGRCMGKCTRTSNECKERYFDVTSNHLDGEALTKKRAKDPAAVEPTSRPARTSGSDDGEPSRPSKRYDPDDQPLREDAPARPARKADPAPRPARVEEDPAPAPSRSSDDEPVRRTATRMSDLGDDKPKPSPEPKRSSGEKVDPMLSSEKPKPDPMLAPSDPPPRSKAKPVDDYVAGDDGPPPSSTPAKKKAKDPEPEPSAPPPEKSKPSTTSKKPALDEWDPNN